MGRGGRGVHDDGAARPAVAHQPRRALGHQEAAVEIDLHMLAPLVVGQIDQGAVAAIAGVEEGGVQAPEPATDRLEQFRHGRRIGLVAGMDQDADRLQP